MAPLVSRQFPDARFLVVGSGPRDEELRRRAAATDAAGKIVFTGQRDDVPNLLTRMQVFVPPSLHEGSPYALLEAMAAGAAIVTTPAGAELLADGVNGLVIPAGSTEAMAAASFGCCAMNSCAAGTAKQLASALKSEHSVKGMVDRYSQLYANLS